jgi:hypothetical protein
VGTVFDSDKVSVGESCERVLAVIVGHVGVGGGMDEQRIGPYPLQAKVDLRERLGIVLETGFATTLRFSSPTPSRLARNDHISYENIIWAARGGTYLSIDRFFYLRWTTFAASDSLRLGPLVS